MYVDGKLVKTLRGHAIVAEFIGMVDNYVASHYADAAHFTRV